MATPEHTNALIDETSPYLLQHAHNPVDWKPWNDKVLEKAKSAEKLIIISVGYAACHWCHVMEAESFEDETVAKIMNEGYINIKVDREERPDVDQAYMNAVQLMTGRGGWPMNVVALPDGRPVWGGTYFPKEQWVSALKQIADLYKKDPEKLQDYADKLEQGLQQMLLIPESKESGGFSEEEFPPLLEKWEKTFDRKFGGNDTAPKFVIPSTFQFLLRYAIQKNNGKLKEYVIHSLDKISYGGIYDHIGGGFSRYSVDERWHVPHFEKMLYDNAQLVSLYSQASKSTKNEWYREVVEQTLDFIKENLTDPSGAFYSSLDADSLDENGKLKEGAFYTWKISELKDLLKEDFELFADYYNVNSFGKWEDDQYVLIRTKSDAEIEEKHQISEEELLRKKKTWQQILKEHRGQRDIPRLDDKQITSWNALMLSGYLEAYKAFGIQEYLETALKNARFLVENLLQPDNSLKHSHKNGESRINAYLEDYALVIEAFLNLYQVTLDTKWLNISQDLNLYCQEHFYEPNQHLFYFTSDKDRPLITRNIEFSDNVLPASNSVMAHNLFNLSKYFDNKAFMDLSEKMLKKVRLQFENYPQGYANWLNLMMNFTSGFHEIVITGKDALDIVEQFNRLYVPNAIIDGTTNEDDRPLTKNRFKPGEDLIYVCTSGTCSLPVKSVKEAMKLF